MDKKTFSQYESQSVNRIRELIATRCNGSQQEFADRTHISKASISQYVNGRNTPSNLTAQKIADAFMVDPAWVQGFDVPMKEQTYYTNPETAASTGQECEFYLTQRKTQSQKTCEKQPSILSF